MSRSWETQLFLNHKKHRRREKDKSRARERESKHSIKLGNVQGWFFKQIQKILVISVYILEIRRKT